MLATVCMNMNSQFGVKSTLSLTWRHDWPRSSIHYEDVIGLYYDVLRGRETYQTFYGNAKGMIKGSVKDLLRKAFSTQ